MRSWLVLVVYGLAVFRVVRFFVSDAMLATPREKLRERSHVEQVRTVIERGNERAECRTVGKPGVALVVWMLMTCSWCLSVWVGLGAVLALHLWPGVSFDVALVLAFSAVAGILSERV